MFVRDSDSIVRAVNEFIAALPVTRPEIIDHEQSSVDALIDSAFRYLRRYLRQHAPPQSL